MATRPTHAILPRDPRATIIDSVSIPAAIANGASMIAALRHFASPARAAARRTR